MSRSIHDDQPAAVAIPAWVQAVADSDVLRRRREQLVRSLAQETGIDAADAATELEHAETLADQLDPRDRRQIAQARTLADVGAALRSVAASAGTRAFHTTGRALDTLAGELADTLAEPGTVTHAALRRLLINPPTP
ncbi:MAG TPA: hypothetical protein VNV44_11730 [Solirubrobacteraceae bacterium]|jgi:hypothetical protein|nr:hypothetical protein [Solirubrobacteraceae bacterium]